MSTAPFETTGTAPMAVSEEVIQRIENNNNRLLLRAKTLVIKDPESYQLACDLVTGIGELKKTIEADFEPTRKAAYAAYQAVLDQKKAHLDKLVEPDRIVRDKIRTYNEEQEQIRQDLERQARERAQREAEERRLQEAIRLEQAGKQEQAEKALSAPIVPAPVVIPKAAVPTTGTGVAMVETWKFEITDRGLVPDQYKVIDESAIAGVVKALKDKAVIPGVRVYMTREPRIAGKRR